MPNTAESSEKTSTRRSKRRVEDLDKPSPTSVRKRQTLRRAATGKVARKSFDSTPSKIPTKNTPVSVKSKQKAPRGTPKPKLHGSKSRLTSKERDQFNKLLQKFNDKSELITVIDDNVDVARVSSSRVNNGQRDGDLTMLDNSRQLTCSVPKGNRRSNAKVNKKGESSSEEDIEEGDGRTEFEEDFSQEEDGDYDVEDDTHDAGNTSDPHENDENGGCTKVGESDEELDVSFHDGRRQCLNETKGTQASPTNDTTCTNSEREDVAQGIVNDPNNRTNEPRTAGSGHMNSIANVNGIDESVLYNVVEMLKKSLFTEMQSSFHKVLNEIRSDRDNAKKLREHISELTSIVTTTASAIFIKQTASQPRGKEIQRKLCLLPALFNDHVMLKILPRVVIGFLVNNIANGSTLGNVERKGVEFLSVMYFSKQPNEKKKEKFDTEVGRIYSKFRYSLLTTTILAMQDNSFNTFRKDDIRTGVNEILDTVVAEESSTISPRLTAMIQPFWLRPGYVLAEHCVLAAKKQEKRAGSDITDEARTGIDGSSQQFADTDSQDMQESSQSSSKTKATRSGPLTQDEIATEAACMVYKVITAVLYRSRASSKIQLFHDIMYLFTGWGQHGVPVDQRTLKINWEKPLTSDIDYLDDLPRTKIIRPNERISCEQDVERTDIANIIHLETLIAHHPELSLIIEHDVMVNGVERRLKYRINLIEVTCRLLAAYVTLESTAKGKDALSSDKRCFNPIMVMSVGLRKLMKKAIDDLNSSNIVPWSNNHCARGKRGRPKRSSAANNVLDQTTEYQFEDVDGINLDQLQPPPSKQRELLSHMMLSVTDEEFTSKMMRTPRGDIANSNPSIDTAVIDNRNARIEADESQSVFRF